MSPTTVPAFLLLFLALHPVRRLPVASESAHIARERRGASPHRRGATFLQSPVKVGVAVVKESHSDKR